MTMTRCSACGRGQCAICKRIDERITKKIVAPAEED